MKLFSDEAQAALESGDNIVSGAVEILCTDPFRVFGGYGTLPLEGGDFTGIGDRGLVQVVGQSVGGSSQAISLALSGVEPEVVDLLDEASAQGASATIRQLIFNGAGTTLLDASIYERGRVDQVVVDETAGGTSTITAMVETSSRTLGRKGGRMRTDADQRLINPNDGSMRAISYAGEKTIYWGGKIPATAASALTGGTTITYKNKAQFLGF